LNEENGDDAVIGSSSPKQLRETIAVMKGVRLPREVVDALNKGWEDIRGKELLYWHRCFSSLNRMSVFLFA
jgi:aflatoxin B1 aldehyde reductase